MNLVIFLLVNTHSKFIEMIVDTYESMMPSLYQFFAYNSIWDSPGAELPIQKATFCWVFLSLYMSALNLTISLQVRVDTNFWPSFEQDHAANEACSIWFPDPSNIFKHFLLPVDDKKKKFSTSTYITFHIIKVANNLGIYNVDRYNLFLHLPSYHL